MKAIFFQKSSCNGQKSRLFLDTILLISILPLVARFAKILVNVFWPKTLEFWSFFLNSFLQAGKMVANWCCRRRCLRVSVTRSRVCPKVKNRKEVSWHSASEEQARTAQPPLGQSFWCVAESVLFWAHAQQRVLSIFRPEARFLSLFFRVDDSEFAAKCVNRALHAKKKWAWRP